MGRGGAAGIGPGEQFGDIVHPGVGGPGEVLAEVRLEHRGGPQLAPGDAVLAYLDGVLELQQQHLFQVRPGVLGAWCGVRLGGVVVGAVADEVQGPAQQSGPVAEVVVDERGGHAGLGGQLAHPQSADPSAGDHAGGGSENFCPTVRHGRPLYAFPGRSDTFLMIVSGESVSPEPNA